MKNKIARFVFYINKFDRHQVQFAYFALMLAVSVVLRVPSDGGGGPT